MKSSNTIAMVFLGCCILGGAYMMRPQAAPVAPATPGEIVPVVASLADRFPDDFAREQCAGLFSDLALQVKSQEILQTVGDVRELTDLSFIVCQNVNQSTGWDIVEDVKAELDTVGDDDVVLTKQLREKYAAAFRCLADRILN